LKGRPTTGNDGFSHQILFVFGKIPSNPVSDYRVRPPFLSRKHHLPKSGWGNVQETHSEWWKKHVKKYVFL
jgi:hypothetical protein